MEKLAVGSSRAAGAAAVMLCAVIISGCSGSAATSSPGVSTSPAGSPATPLVATPSAPPSLAAASVTPGSTSYAPGAVVRYVQGGNGKFDVRHYDLSPDELASGTWSEPASFRLAGGFYYVGGECAGAYGRSLGLTLFLQQIREADGAIAQEYAWQCGPVETTFVFGEMRFLPAGLYRAAVRDATTGASFEIGPESPDYFLRDAPPASSAPSAPAGAQALTPVVPCPPGIDYEPGPAGQTPCITFQLAWSGAASAATYRVYEAWRMPGAPLPPCDPTTAHLSIDTGGATNATTGIYVPVRAQGTCFWVAAANKAGESAWTAVDVVF